MIMEAKKSRSRRASVTVAVQVQRPEKQESQCYNFQLMSESKGRRPVSSSKTIRQREYIPPSTDWMRATHIVQDSVLMKMLPLPRNTFADTPGNNVHQISGHPMAQSTRHIKLTITVVMSRKIYLGNNGQVLQVHIPLGSFLHQKGIFRISKPSVLNYGPWRRASGVS